MIEILNFAAIGFAVLAFSIILYETLSRRKENNFTTFALFSALYGSMLHESIKNQQDFPILIVIATGSMLVAVISLSALKWEKMDTLISGVVVACIAIGSTFGGLVYWISFAIPIAGFPYITHIVFSAKVYKGSKTAHFLLVLAFLILLIACFMSGKNSILAWISFMYWLVVAIISAKRNEYHFIH